MNDIQNKTARKSPSEAGGSYYRLIALWVLCEAMLGGIIHGLKIPVSGLIVGSCAIICICLIGWYMPQRGSIIKATIIVAIFKMMLSPHAPPPAYIAVFFQGLLGELLLRDKKFFRLSCIILAVLGLLESGLQRILVLTIVYGNDLWKVINDFINGLTKQKTTTNYSLWIGGIYVLLHFITGIFVGWWASVLPKRIERWSNDPRYIIETGEAKPVALPAISKKRRKLKTGLFIIWLLLIALYAQSYYKIGTPLLPPHISLKILLRSLIIVLFWIFIAGPLLRKLLHRWLKKKQSQSQQDVQEVLRLLPATQQLMAESWKRTAGQKGLSRLSIWSRMVFVNALPRGVKEIAAKPVSREEQNSVTVLPPSRQNVYVLSAPIQSGKTTSLSSWSLERNDVFGILTPVVEGKRVFMNAHSKEQFPMEAEPGEEQILTVGKFIFSKESFDKAIVVLQGALHESGWLVIDEIGPLELRGEGFYNVVAEIVGKREGKTILVVRKGLQEEVIKYFGIEQASKISTIAGLD